MLFYPFWISFCGSFNKCNILKLFNMTKVELSDDELFYAIALTKISGIGPVLTKRLIEFAGSATNVFSLSSKELIQVPKINENSIRNYWRSLFLN